MSETCEACGEPFSCGLSMGGCWCSEVPLTEMMYAQLREVTNIVCAAHVLRDLPKKIQTGMDRPERFEISNLKSFWPVHPCKFLID